MTPPSSGPAGGQQPGERPARLRTLRALQRFLREYEDVPGRDTSKRLARHALAVLGHRPRLDRRCRLTLDELLALPPYHNPRGRPGTGGSEATQGGERPPASV